MLRVRGQTYMSSLHCFFAVGSDISILRAPMAAAISRWPLMSPLKPSQPMMTMMSDDVSDEDRPQDRELRPLLFFRIVCEFFNVPQSHSDKM